MVFSDEGVAAARRPSPRVALEGKDLGVVDEPVGHRGDGRRRRPCPSGEALVGRDDQAGCSQRAGDGTGSRARARRGCSRPGR